MSDVRRARRLMARRGAWIEAMGDGYVVRLGRDRRTRPALAVDEAAFRALVESPGLRTRSGGGWTSRGVPPASIPAGRAGRPGAVVGEASLIEPGGAVILKRANAARSAIRWLAGRRDENGRPWLCPAEVAAAERLGLEAETALKGPSLTMRWDALPRSGGWPAAKAGPDDRALAASRKVEAALRACGAARAMVDQVCIRASASQVAENALGLRRREGKRLLRQGLQALVAHYRGG